MPELLHRRFLTAPRPRSGLSERTAHNSLVVKPQPASPLLRANNVSKAYREGVAQTDVLRAASLELARGETTSLIGVSGSGKSTLVSLLAGLRLPDSGEIFFDGQDITVLDDVERARLRARRIGVVLQRDNLIPFLTAMENVRLAIEIAGGRQPGARAKELLADLGLAHRMDHLPRRMSGGEAQRVSVAVALANDPELLLADEITGELDASNAEEVMRVVLDAWRERGLTILLVTHDQDLAARTQHRMRLADGELKPA
jgi:predicted ABC-type transport system involved in lysophospholipase L1 biosynthesis ATPase subunit